MRILQEEYRKVIDQSENLWNEGEENLTELVNKIAMIMVMVTRRYDIRDIAIEQIGICDYTLGIKGTPMILRVTFTFGHFESNRRVVLEMHFKGVEYVPSMTMFMFLDSKTDLKVFIVKLAKWISCYEPVDPKKCLKMLTTDEGIKELFGDAILQSIHLADERDALDAKLESRYLIDKM